MKKTAPTPAKVSMPLLRSVYERTRLFTQLDAAEPVTWISGPPGAGKTVLLTSYIQVRKRPSLWYQMDAGDNDLASFFHYLGLAAKKAAPRIRKPLPALTPEYLPGLATFARRYFEELATRLPYGTMIVVDDYHTLAADAPLHEIVLNSFEQLPAGINLVIISREPPPPIYARALLHNAIKLIDPEELRLTEEESSEFAQTFTQGKTAPALTSLRSWYEQTQGWTAGLVLVLQQQTPENQAFCATSPQVMFDYFAQEIFERTESGTRQLLLACAFVPKVSISIAQALSGLADAAERLEWLRRKNYFTSKRGTDAIYEFHPLFREFLMAQARASFIPAHLLKVQQQAALLLEQAGDIENAATLLQAAQDWDNLARLIALHAPTLLAEGRWQTLQSWINAIPSELLEQPWLRFWLGMSRLMISPVEARQDFTLAFAAFEAGNDILGQWLAWSGVADSFLYAWDDFTGLDPWIKRLDDLLQYHLTFPSIDIELRVSNSAVGALLYRQPQHPRLFPFVTRLEALIPQTSDSVLRVMVSANLVNHYTWLGDFKKCLSFFDTMRANTYPATPPLLVLWQWIHQLSAYWSIGAFEDCAQLVDKAMEVGRYHGVLIMEFAFLSQSAFAFVGSGDLVRAAEAIEQSAKVLNPLRRQDIAYYHFAAGWLLLRQGNHAAAEHHARKSVELTNLIGAVFPRALSQLALAQVLIAGKDYTAALPYIKEGGRLGRESNSVVIEYMCLLTDTYLAMRAREEVQMLTLLSDALALAKACRIINPPWWLPEIMSSLMGVALKAGIEVDFAAELIRTLKLTPDISSTEDLEHWPWPVRIYTLGRFGIIRDGEPIKSTARTQKRALDLLKALIAFGGREVSEQKLCDVLWPEADDARANLKMTLHRLRGLIGQEVVTLQESRLSLDPAICWVDAWAFERCANQLSVSATTLSSAELLRFGERMLTLYKGAFLGDEEHPFALTTRERLRGKWMRAIAAIAEGFQREGTCDLALNWYERGIDVDPLAEPFYQGLMRACLSCGRAAEGLAIYERLRKTLACELQIAPAPDSETLARALRTISA